MHTISVAPMAAFTDASSIDNKHMAVVAVITSAACHKFSSVRGVEEDEKKANFAEPDLDSVRDIRGKPSSSIFDETPLYM